MDAKAEKNYVFVNICRGKLQEPFLPVPSGVSTIRQFVPETCTAIYEVLKEKYLKCPDTVEEWQQVADGFQAQWDFPNCLGALDGKHINIRPPPGTGSTYFNYKHTFSIVLMALVDSNYKFLYVDVGCNGRISDGGVFGGCSLQDALENKTFNIPAPAPLPASDQAVCYHIVADEAFPLKEYLMKPYPNRRLAVEQRIFNYRLSQARRVESMLKEDKTRQREESFLFLTINSMMEAAMEGET
ncbi:protein ALP1-like [Gymnodraco acuticeps]|uniref:Protein ALP1-like n=1 Tax=Gymnodraco acuticeps TaxID=8218 RepID=A0A6P8TBE7_GYMAC|nr:protein ALP1-like [Gymnodraco acuticeps]